MLWLDHGSESIHSYVKAGVVGIGLGHGTFGQREEHVMQRYFTKRTCNLHYYQGFFFITRKKIMHTSMGGGCVDTIHRCGLSPTLPGCKRNEFVLTENPGHVRRPDFMR